MTPQNNILRSKNTARKEKGSHLRSIEDLTSECLEEMSHLQKNFPKPNTAGQFDNIKKNFIAPFYGCGSTASKLEPLRGDSLLFTTKFPEISGTHFIDLRRMKG